MVYIALHPSVNIIRFLHKNEAYVLKERVETTMILPAGKKEVSVLVTGLHPNTKDQAVVRYLAAHGKVSQTDHVVHHVFPGKPGTSLLAGKLNGNRSYMVDITKHMGSFHIIDGEKVSVKYRGQIRSCARCHQQETNCPGKGVARDCTSERVLLSTHMQEHWKDVNYTPDNSTCLGLDNVDIDLDIQIGKANFTGEGPDLTARYNSVIISGFLATTEIESIHQLLVTEKLLPPETLPTALLKNEKSGKITLQNLKPEVCLNIMENMHGKSFLGRKVFVTSVVAVVDHSTVSEVTNNSENKEAEIRETASEN